MQPLVAPILLGMDGAMRSSPMPKRSHQNGELDEAIEGMRTGKRLPVSGPDAFREAKVLKRVLAKTAKLG